MIFTKILVYLRGDSRLAVIHVGGGGGGFSLIMTLHLLWQKLEPEIRIITQIFSYTVL